MERHAKKLYIVGNALIPVLALLIPLVRPLSDRLPSFLGGCFMHDWLHLYCAFCGGTRAMESLVRLDLRAACQHNPLVVLLVGALIVWDIVALIRMLRKQARWWAIPACSGVVLIVLMIGYMVVRNLLLIAFSYDPVGDLGQFWLR